MTVLYLTEYNTRCYGITFQNNGYIIVQKVEDISADENNIYCVMPLKSILGKSKICDMTLASGALDKSVFDGNAILLKISKENDEHRYVYIGGDMVCSFLTDDNIYENISKMGNILTPYSITIGMENIYFLTPHFKFIKREKIDNLLKRNEHSVDPYDYHI